MILSNISRSKFSLLIRKFASSDYFIILIAAISYLCWAFNAVFLGLGIMSVILAVLLITQPNSIYTLPVFLLAFYMVPNFVNAYYWTAVFLVPLGASIIFNLIVYKRKISKGGLFYPILATFLAGMIGGLIYTTTNYNFFEFIKDFGFMALLTACFTGSYLFFNSTVSIEDFNYKKYISKIFLYLSLLMLAEMLTFYLRSDDIFLAIAQKRLKLGWGNTNTLATVIMSTIPFTLCLSTQYRKGGFFTIAAFVQYIAIWITHSRGCIIISSVVMFAYIVYLLIIQRGFNRGFLIANTAVFIIFVSLFVLLYTSKFKELFGDIIIKGLDDSGRFSLYEKAWNLFKQNLIFGTGYFYKTDQIRSFMYMFHSIPLQIAANLGIIGLIAFAYFYFVKYKLMFKNLKNPLCFAIFLSIFSMDLYGMIDVVIFVYYHAIAIIVLLIFLQKIDIAAKSFPNKTKEVNNGSNNIKNI